MFTARAGKIGTTCEYDDYLATYGLCLSRNGVALLHSILSEYSPDPTEEGLVRVWMDTLYGIAWKENAK
jgi:cyclopropane fatty-acyl-phospholipid synthase-like methyltransferase